MGSSQSSQLQTINTLLNQSVTKIVNKTKASANAINTNTNTFTLQIGPGAIVNCANLNLAQSIIASQQVTLNVTIQDTTDLTNILTGAANDVLSQNNSAVNSFLTTAFSNQSSSTDAQTTIDNLIQTNITNTDVSNCNAILTNANNGTIIVNGKLDCTNLNNPQAIISDQFVQAIVNAGISAILNNSAIANAVTNANQSNSSTNNGIFSLFGSSSITYIIIAIIIIIIIGSVIYYYYKKNNSTNTIASKFNYMLQNKPKLKFLF